MPHLLPILRALIPFHLSIPRALTGHLRALSPHPPGHGLAPIPVALPFAAQREAQGCCCGQAAVVCADPLQNKLRVVAAVKQQ